MTFFVRVSSFISGELFLLLPLKLFSKLSVLSLYILLELVSLFICWEVKLFCVLILFSEYMLLELPN